MKWNNYNPNILVLRGTNIDQIVIIGFDHVSKCLENKYKFLDIRSKNIWNLRKFKFIRIHEYRFIRIR